MRFPPSVRNSFLIHNGESEESDGLFDLWKFLSLQEVKMWWDEMRLIKETEGSGGFDITSMIPVMFREGDLRYVDRSESDSESPLVEWNHEAPTRDIRADSFLAFLNKFLLDFRGGAMIAEPEFDLRAIVTVKDL